MIQIKELGQAVILTSEGAAAIRKATPFEEHQLTTKILKLCYAEGFYAEVQTDAKLPFETGGNYGQL